MASILDSVISTVNDYRERHGKEPGAISFRPDAFAVLMNDVLKDRVKKRMPMPATVFGLPAMLHYGGEWMEAVAQSPSDLDRPVATCLGESS